MSGADFDWTLVNCEFLQEEHPIIVIIDLDQGNRTVTNDVENVLDQIRGNIPRPYRLGKLPIIYRDTSGDWDQILVDEEGRFLEFDALPRNRDLQAIKQDAICRHNYRRQAALFNPGGDDCD